MRLTDLVSVDNRFEKSINLLLDLNNEKKVADYIPTRSSIIQLAKRISERLEKEIQNAESSLLQIDEQLGNLPDIFELEKSIEVKKQEQNELNMTIQIKLFL